MSEIDQLQIELTKQLNNALASYVAQYYRDKFYLGLSFEQGKRKMIQINVPATDLPTLLQAKPSHGNDPDSGKNRPVIKGHAQEVKEYLLKRIKQDKPWILGTLTANVNPDDLKMVEIGWGLCIVIIPSGTKLDITDGQHRKTAIDDLITSQDSKLIGQDNFPITLVLEKDFNQCQTDFRDMAQTKQLDQSLLLSFGEFEGVVGITKNLIERVPMFKNKTDKIKKSPSSKHKLIYTTNFVAQLVSCAFTNNTEDELINYDVEYSSEILVGALNQLFSECSDTRHIFEKSEQELNIQEIDHFKDNCILGRSVGLEILGRLIYCTYDPQNQYFIPEKIAQIAQLDWKRTSPIWQNNVVLIDSNPRNPAKPYKIVAGKSAVKIALDRAKIALGWIILPEQQEINL